MSDIEGIEAEDIEPGPEEPTPTYEATDADTAEQQADVRAEEDEPQGQPPVEVNEADFVEQGRVVRLDEDEYR
ncbi:hypothetical protein DZF91_16620 [Actinomadura logoneensis]|uniref:Uncharacterized protein n=1 Tax=Actinomadura logoneensis TaxID=2293572 RepID=A0A372JKI8_9ACTN|nr:hypothetical protein [Actinomadura logoneensis]RFU40541.1 hypothetical protein DZF91_16620 [Actinomadura logoneensis]